MTRARIGRWLAAALVCLAAAPAHAQLPLGLEDCAVDPLDVDTLRLRLDLGLRPEVRDRVTSGAQRVLLRRDCETGRVTIRVEGREGEVSLDRSVEADLWTLKSVIEDLLDRQHAASLEPGAEAQPAPEELEGTREVAPAEPAEPPSTGFLGWRMERPYEPSPQPTEDAPARSTFRVGASGRVYFGQPTLLGGGYVGVEVDWVSLRLSVLGTSAGNEQAQLTGALVTVEGALRAVQLEDPAYRFGLWFSVAGGLVHSDTALAADPETGAPADSEVLSGASLGAGARIVLTAIFDPAIEADVALTLGYDVGQAMREGLADARGVYLGLDLGLRLPL